MAILSNINGKFAVDSTGAIQLSGSAGTANYVLVSGGAAAAPTWVAGSTVIGGPYLPLSGGTLTGATATASGISFTSGGTISVNATTALTLSLNSTHANGGYMRMMEGGAAKLFIGTRGSVSGTSGTGYDIYTVAGNDLRFFTNGTNLALTIDTSQNATFAGNVTVSGTGANLFSGDLDVSGTKYLYLGGWVRINNPGSGTFKLGQYNGSSWTDTLNITNAGAATFTGKILLSQNGTSFEHGYSGNGLVLSHHNVGPSNAIVSGDGSNPDNLYINNGGAASDWSNVIITGNVGIGTVSPSTQLDVYHSTAPRMSLSFAGGSGNGGAIDFNLINGGVSQPITLQIKGIDDGAYRQHMTFSTKLAATGASALEERMRITSAGNVGIGTISPTHKLHVYSAAPTGGIGLKVESGNATNWIQNKCTAGSWQIGSTGSGFQLYNDDTSSYRFTVQNGGNVGIGTTSPSTILQVESTDPIITLERNNNGSAAGAINFQGNDNVVDWQLGTNQAIGLGFEINEGGGTNNRFYIAPGGYTKITDDGDTTWNGYDFHAITQSAASEPTVMIYNDNAGGNNYGINVIHRSTSANTTGRFFLGATNNGGTENIKIYTNGNIQNTNNSYTQLSDSRLKENIVDATSKLEEIKRLRVVNWNFIGDDLKQIGMVAQEVEEIFPGLVDVTGDNQIIHGTTYENVKSLKYSVLVPILVKAIQELEARVTELENN